MRYPDSHWRKVARYMRWGWDAAMIQNKYPATTVGTVRRWMLECRKRGLA